MALLKFKRSAVPAKIPSIADLALGELAINTYDGKVYTKKDDGTQAIVEVGGGGGVQTITSSDGSVTVTGTTDINLSVPVTAATQTVILPVRNNTGATLAKGTAVYINGALGQNPTVTKAIATGDATSAQTLGLVTANIANNAVGNVTLIGSLTNLDTSAYTDGAQLYLSPTTAGALTATKPYAPNHLVYMAVVEHAHPTLGKLFVKVQNGYEMDELHDVSAQNPANNDGLFYNTTSGLWEKKSIATALGYTPASTSGPTFSNGITVNNGDNQVQIAFDGNLEIVRAAGNPYIDFKNTVGEDFDSRIQQVGSGFAMTGTVSAGDEFRAPIFRDTPNTAYYVDPAGTSNISGLTLDGTLTGVTGRFAKNQIAGNYTTAALWTESYGSTATGIAFHISGNVGKFLEMRTDGILYWQGIFNSDGELRAPIFRDMNNGAFYLDLDGTSNLNQINLGDSTKFIRGGGAGQTILGVGGVNEAYLQVGGSYYSIWNSGNFNPASYLPLSGGTLTGSVTIPELFVSDNTPTFTSSAFQYHLHQSPHVAYVKQTGGYNWYWRRNSTGTLSGTSEVEDMSLTEGGNLIVRSDVRAPIFYDSNDTSFYTDPSVNSVIRTLYLRNGSIPVQAKFAEASQFGYSSSYKTIVLGNEYLTTISMGVDVSGNASGSFNGQGEGREVLFRNGVTFITPNSANNGYLPTFNMTDGYVTSGGSVRSPIFYDSDNTAYYVNPASGSVLGGQISFAGGTVISANGDITARRDSGATGVYYFAGGVPYLYWDGGQYLFSNAGPVIASGTSFRAPIFYDSDNTAYYVDPNGRSILSNISIISGATECGIRFRGDTLDFVGRFSDYMSMYNQISGGEIKLFNSGFFNCNQYGVNEASWRAPIFYDTNDTGRYVDPNSTSNLYRLSSYIAAQDVNSNWNTGFQNTPAYSYNYHGDLNGGTNAPAAGWWFYESMRHSNASNFWGTQIAWGWEDNANRLLQRNVSGNSFSAWVEYLNTSGRTFSGDLTMGSSLRAPIFYDSPNSAYYLDPASGSYLSSVTFDGLITGRNSPSTDVNSANDTGSISIRGSTTTVAAMSFHRAGAYAINMGLGTDNVFRIGGWSATSNAFQMDGSGNLTMTGNVTAYSDARLKKDVSTVTNALELVSKMRGVTYTRIDTGEAGVGVIAQEMLEVMPQVVQQGIGDNDTLSVAYGNLVGVLIEAIKELRVEVETLKNRS